jgi:hypothetical protein
VQNVWHIDFSFDPSRLHDAFTKAAYWRSSALAAPLRQLSAIELLYLRFSFHCPQILLVVVTS